MLPFFVGCNLPFTFLFLTAIGSIICSFIIGEAEGFAPPVGPRFLNRAVLKTASVSTNDPTIHHLNNQEVHPLKHVFTTAALNLLNNNCKCQHEQEYLHNISRLSEPLPGCPPTSLKALRKLYGRRKTFWGDWTNQQTREFYQTKLPRALQHGAFNMTLEQRAKLASEARHALRLYSRERCHLPGRIVSRWYDGMRHLFEFGSWNPEGMSWEEVKAKYMKQARSMLPEHASQQDILSYVYRKIVDKACETNELFDSIAYHGAVEVSKTAVTALLTSVFDATTQVYSGGGCSGLHGGVNGEAGAVGVLFDSERLDKDGDSCGSVDTAKTSVSASPPSLAVTARRSTQNQSPATRTQASAVISSAHHSSPPLTGTGSASSRVTASGNDDSDQLSVDVTTAVEAASSGVLSTLKRRLSGQGDDNLPSGLSRDSMSISKKKRPASQASDSGSGSGSGSDSGGSIYQRRGGSGRGSEFCMRNNIVFRVASRKVLRMMRQYVVM